MKYNFSFPAPESIISDTVCLLKAESNSSISDSFITLNREKNSLILFGITKGSVLFSYDETTLNLSQGSAVLLPPNSYNLFAETDCEYTYFTIGGSFAHALMEKTLKQGGRYFPSGAPVLSGELSKINHAETLGIKPNGNMASLSAYTILMKLYLKSSNMQEKSYPSLISNAIAIIRENFAFLYGIEDLAEQLFVSKNHLIREFKKCVGISPGKFLTATRIEHSKLVLQSGETSLEAVAVACGFSDANYFCKVFKKETGMKPSEFLKTAPKTENTPIQNHIYL